MRRLRLDHPVSPGATLARDVTGAAGEIIARTGHALTERTVRALRGRGVTWCYVEDLWGAGVHVTPLDGGHGTVRPVLREFEQRLSDLVAPLLSLSTQRAVEVIRRTHPTAPLARGRCAEEMPSAVRAFIEGCDEVDPRGGFLPDRESVEDEAGHAIGVAAVTSQIARQLGMDAAERVAVVTAAVVHDIGMVFVPPAVRMTPAAQRTVPERSRYEDHALLGEVLLEPLGAPAMHAAIVAAEHHEAADGSGYPRRRVGGHRVLRTAEEKRDLDRLTLASEIVAVADAYERIVSPGPGWDGCSPAAARVMLEQSAGRTLNREIVHRFLASFPALPLGTEVQVVRGTCAGMRGIVCDLPAGHEEQPLVRLFLDAQGRPLGEPVELRLWEQPDAAIEVAEAA